MLRQQHRFFRSVLIGSDLALVVAAGVAAYGLRFYVLAGVLPPAGGAESHAYSTYAIPMEFAAPIMMLALLWVGQYRPRRDERFYLEAGTIVKGVAIGLGATIVTLGMFQNILFGGRHYSGVQFMLYGACATMGLLAWRFSFRMALRYLRARGLNLRHVAIIGAGRLGQRVYHTLKRNTWTGITPVFFVSHRKHETRSTCLGLPLSGLADLESTFDAAQITGVFIAVPGRMSAMIPKLITSLQDYPLDVRVVPDVNPRYVPMNMSAGELDGLPVLSIRESPFNGWGGVLKRSVDMVGLRPMAELITGIRDEWDGCMLRQNVKPGITGWAQVNGHRGHSSLRKRLQYDLFYIRNWSIMFDMRILLMTLFRGFANPHAN